MRWTETLLSSRGKVQAGASLAIAIIAVVDWRVQPNVSLGFLYIIPLLVAAGFLSRLQIVLLGVACAVLREAFSPSPWEADYLAREAVVAGVFVASGLFVNELLRNRQRAIEHAREMAREVALRTEAEQQLRVLIDSNPAAIVTVDADGKVLLANNALRQLLASGAEVEGRPIADFVPALARVPHARGDQRGFQTTMECTAHTADGRVFLAHVWFSTYVTDSGPRLAAIVLDSSEHLRDREGLGLLSLMTSSRVMVVAMLHEIRNLCAAAAVAHTNLERQPGVAGSKDFAALGTLVKGLTSLASSELRSSTEHASASANLKTILDELRIVIEPSFAEADTAIRWEVPDSSRMVSCDHHSLLQVFLNLAQNSLQAMQGRPRRELTVSVSEEGNGVAVRFSDTGRGVLAPERLFRLFQPDSGGAGLGLCVSRAIVRSFAGDLYYEPQAAGSCFVVHLASRDGKNGEPA